MCGRGPSCSSSCCCRSCFSLFSRWKQIARPARTTAIEYLVRLRRSSDVDLGACARRARICDGIHSLFARSKRLSNVGPASARGSIWPDWQRRQKFAKKECFVLRSRFGACVCLCLFAARADRNSGGGTTASEGDLHAETCLPT